MMGCLGFGNVELGIYKVFVSGKCRWVWLEILYKEVKFNIVLGVGFIYKSKKL